MELRISRSLSGQSGNSVLSINKAVFISGDRYLRIKTAFICDIEGRYFIGD